MNFGILGYGNLGKALASALTCTGEVKAGDISVCDISGEALSLAKKEGFKTYTSEDISLMTEASDVICLVVKGHIFKELAETIDKTTLRGKTVISFMAGMSIPRITSYLSSAETSGEASYSRTGEGMTLGKPHIARAMPSLSIAKNEGVIAYTKLPEEIAAILGKFGFAFETEPENIEKVMAFAACGLGFAAYLVDAYKVAGEKIGFSPQISAQIAAQTFRNACDSENFRKTVDSVATPGGAAEQGIAYLSECDVYAIITETVNRAYQKMI